MVNLGITGVSGYLGRHLVKRLAEEPAFNQQLLFHSSPPPSSLSSLPKCYAVYGDLTDVESIRHWLAPGSTVVHLAYMWEGGRERNLLAAANLCEACRIAEVTRIIHVSTAAVVGRASSDLVTEETPCHPISEYGKTKLAIEACIQEAAARTNIDLVILRPTSIFGPMGAPLKLLAEDLSKGFWFKNYLKSGLFGCRAMNLVHVSNVVAAVRFFIGCRQNFGGEAFFISEDEDHANNFADVEKAILDVLEIRRYPIPLLHLPSFVLSVLLRLRHRDIINPYRRFSSARIESLGFTKPNTFADGLHDYLAWYRDTVLVKRPADRDYLRWR